MEQEIKRLLEHNTELLEENNRLIKKMNRRARWATVTHVIYWILIIGVSGVSYYYVQPYLNKLIATYTSLQKNIDSLNNANPFR